MKKHSFFDRQAPAVTLLYSPESIEEAITTAYAAECDGADGIALELLRMPLELRTLENFRRIIDSVQLPFMFIDYRNDIFLSGDDDARQQYLLMAADAGAEVIDVMGDLYKPSPLELTRDQKAVDKQIKLIDSIHEHGAKVLMSSHTNAERSAEEVLEHLLEQSSRGADILKIVVGMNSEESMLEGIRTLLLLRKNLDKPFVFLGGGKFGRFIRYTGSKLGAAIEFAVHAHRADRPYNQPTIKSFRKVLDNFHWDIDNLSD